MTKRVRNTGVVFWHAIQGIIPSVAGAVSGQKYDVIEREGALHGTRNAIDKIVHTKGIVGKLSAVFAEATDGPVDDLLNVGGGAQWMIVPATRSNAAAVLRGKGKPDDALAA
jgi:hypothetical protein